jgi:hypothetical protein
MAPLIPKLRGHFAEFLHQSSLARLSILYSPTCVGFGTGTHVTPHEDFLGGISDDLQNHKELQVPPLSTLSRIFLRLGLGSHTTIPTVVTPGLLMSRPPLDQHFMGGLRILTQYPSPTPFGLGLGPD